MRKIKIGVVGCGYMGQAVHLPIFARLDKCEIKALSDNRVKLGQKIAEKYGIPKFFPQMENLLEEKIDAVVVLTPESTHPSICLKAINKGKHVFVEKPLAMNSKEAWEVVKAAKSKKVRLMVGYMKRYDPGCIKVKHLLEDPSMRKEMGDIVFVRVHDFGGDWICGFSPSLIQTDEPHERIPDLGMSDFIENQDKEMYYGTIANNCHDINLMRYLIGDPEEVTFSQIRKGANTWLTRSISVFDYGDFETCLEIGRVDSSLWDEEVVIYFQRGWIKLKVVPPLLRNVASQIVVCINDKKIEYPFTGWGWSFENQAKHFLDCLIDDKEPISSGYDSCKDLEVLELMYESYKYKKKFPLKFK